MVAFVGLATPVEITISGTANSWIDYDLDTYIASLPADVTGVHVRLINVHSSTWYEFGIRKMGLQMLGTKIWHHKIIQKLQ